MAKKKSATCSYHWKMTSCWPGKRRHNLASLEGICPKIFVQNCPIACGVLGGPMPLRKVGLFMPAH